MAPDIVTAEQIADELGVHVQTIRRHFRDGSLPGRKVGHGWRTTQEAYRVWLTGSPAGVSLETSPIELEHKDAAEDRAVLRA